MRSDVDFSSNRIQSRTNRVCASILNCSNTSSLGVCVCIRGKNYPLLSQAAKIKPRKHNGQTWFWQNRRCSTKKKKNKTKPTETGSVFRSDILQTLYREILNWPGSMNSTKRRNSKNKTQNSHSSTLYCCTSERKFIHRTCFSTPLFLFTFLQSHLVLGGISKLNPNSSSWKCRRALMTPSFKIYWFFFFFA